MMVVRALALVLALAAGQAFAAATPAKLTAAEQADVARIEKALNEARTLQAKFLQIAHNGNHATGLFYMSRPGRMRLAYDPPVKDFVVSDGWFVFYWDAELEQQSSQPLGASLADFFLRDTIKLGGDVTLTKFLKQAGAIEVSLVESDDPGKGELTLVFEDKPLKLRSWRVVDAQGLTTTVALSDVQVGVKLDSGLFIFREPAHGPRTNRR